MEANELLTPTEFKRSDLVLNPLAQNTRQTEVIECLCCQVQRADEDNIKTDLREFAWKDVDWIHSAQDRDQLL
jgi:hypothetical protein